MSASTAPRTWTSSSGAVAVNHSDSIYVEDTDEEQDEGPVGGSSVLSRAANVLSSSFLDYTTLTTTAFGTRTFQVGRR